MNTSLYEILSLSIESNNTQDFYDALIPTQCSDWSLDTHESKKNIIMLMEKCVAYEQTEKLARILTILSRFVTNKEMNGKPIAVVSFVTSSVFKDFIYMLIKDNHLVSFEEILTFIDTLLRDKSLRENCLEFQIDSLWKLRKEIALKAGELLNVNALRFIHYSDTNNGFPSSLIQDNLSSEETHLLQVICQQWNEATAHDFEKMIVFLQKILPTQMCHAPISPSLERNSPLLILSERQRLSKNKR